MKLVADGWVYSSIAPPFSKWSRSWCARCRICDTVVTKYDETEAAAVEFLAVHVKAAHSDGDVSA